jgi:quinol monooxygenase YgiN
VLEVPTGAVFGVSLYRGDAEAILPVLREDYEYLAKNPDFLEAHVVESTTEPGLFFHLSKWRSEEAFSAAREDPEVHRILGGLPDGAFAEAHPSVAWIVARDGSVATRAEA